jgi:hypothetical protein
MSNLSELITNLNEADHTSLNQFGSAIGTIADFSGGIGLITTAAQLVSSLISPDKTAELLQDIRNEIEQGFAKLGLEIKAGELLREMDNTDLITKDAEGIYLTLKATVSTQVDKNEALRQIGVCATALNALSISAHPEQWRVVHDDQVYFSHQGDRNYIPGGASSSVFQFPTGSADEKAPALPDAFNCRGLTFSDTFDPGGDGNGQVFSYVYTLPAYMNLVMIFLATAAALDPDYAKPDKFGDVIKLAADDLLILHDTIKAGIVNVVAPNGDSMIIPFPFSRLDSPAVGFGYIEQRSSGLYNNTWWHFGWGAGELITDLGQPYGAVNVYSGYHSIRGYPALGIPLDVFPNSESPQTSPPTEGSDFFIRPVSKYLLRCLARCKDVYRDIGLPAVRQTIEHLRSLIGEAPLPQPSFADFSLREVLAVLGFPENHLIPQPVSIGGLNRYLATSTPFFFLQKQASLRKLIDGMPPDDPFTE